MYDLRILLIWVSLGFLLYLITIRPEPLRDQKKSGRDLKTQKSFSELDWLVSRSDHVLIERLNETRFVEGFNRTSYKPGDYPDGLIPDYIIQDLSILPLSADGEVLVLAMVDPFDLNAVDLVREMTGMIVKPVKIRKKDFKRLVTGDLETINRA